MFKRYLLIFLIFFSMGASHASQYPNAEKLEKVFEKYLTSNKIIYTKVPRGLVISIDEKIFFNKNEAKIKESSLKILDTIALIIKDLPNEFVIENHTTEILTDPYQWELSIIRANNLAQYFIKYHKFPKNKITSLGLGNSVPYRYKKSEMDFDTNNRIDFVILEYETMR